MVTRVEPSSRHEASVEAAVSLVDAPSSKETTTPEKEAESSDLDGAIEARSDASANALQDRTGSEVPLGCPPMALVCDDFEDGNLDGWNKLESGGALVIDAAHASSGKSALSIVIPGNQRGGFLERKGAPLFPLPNNTISGVSWCISTAFPTDTPISYARPQRAGTRPGTTSVSNTVASCSTTTVAPATAGRGRGHPRLCRSRPGCAGSGVSTAPRTRCSSSSTASSPAG